MKKPYEFTDQALFRSQLLGLDAELIARETVQDSSEVFRWLSIEDNRNPEFRELNDKRLRYYSFEFDLDLFDEPTQGDDSTQG